MVAGDVAFEQIAIRYQQLKEKENLPDVPFLFCNVYQDVLSNPNYTNYFPTSQKGGLIGGINIQEPFQKKIDLLMQMNPSSNGIAFVFDEMPSTIHQISYLKSLINSSTLNTYSLPITIHPVSLFSQFKEKLIELQKSNQSIIVMNAKKLYIDSSKNFTVAQHLISQWVIANVDANVMGPINQGFAIDVKKIISQFFFFFFFPTFFFSCD